MYLCWFGDGGRGKGEPWRTKRRFMRTSVRLLQNHRGGGHVALPHLLLLLPVLVHLEQNGHMAHPHTAGPLPGHQVVLPLRPLQRGEVVQQPITCRQGESSLRAAMIQRHVFANIKILLFCLWWQEEARFQAKDRNLFSALWPARPSATNCRLLVLLLPQTSCSLVHRSSQHYHTQC